MTDFILVLHGGFISHKFHRMHPPGKKKGGGGVAEKNMALGTRFQKLRGTLLSGGRLNSQRGRGKLNS